MSPQAQVHFKILQKPIPKRNQGAKLAPKSNSFFLQLEIFGRSNQAQFFATRIEFLPLQLFCEIALSQYNNCSAYLKIGLPMKQLVVSTNNISSKYKVMKNCEFSQILQGSIVLNQVFFSAHKGQTW